MHTNNWVEIAFETARSWLKAAIEPPTRIVPLDSSSHAVGELTEAILPHKRDFSEGRKDSAIKAPPRGKLAQAGWLAVQVGWQVARAVAVELPPFCFD